jgi:hypothetical protein
MEIRLISIAGLHSKKWKAHAADDNGFPLCRIRKKEGVPVIPGTVKLECERCRDELIRRMEKKSEKVLDTVSAIG